MTFQAVVLESKVGPKWDPNRIFDAEALRKPLEGLLERSWRPLEPKKVSLEASWRLSAGDLGDVGASWPKKCRNNAETMQKQCRNNAETKQNKAKTVQKQCKSNRRPAE